MCAGGWSRADRAQLMKISADYVRMSITHGISHEDAGEELLEFMRCAWRGLGLRVSPLFYYECVAAWQGGVTSGRPGAEQNTVLADLDSSGTSFREVPADAGRRLVCRICMCCPTVVTA